MRKFETHASGKTEDHGLKMTPHSDPLSQGEREFLTTEKAEKAEGEK